MLGNPPVTRTLVWFRGKDLRLSDHAPLCDAVKGGEVIPLFVLDPYFFSEDRAKELPHRIQFLLDSLKALSENLAHRGSQLLVVKGKSTAVVPELAARWKVDRVVAHRWTEPFGRERDRRIAESCTAPFTLYEGETLAAPGAVLTDAGEPYAVFSPFARRFRLTVDVASPLSAPRRLPPVPADVLAAADTVELPGVEALGLPRNGALLAGGERAARDRLARFTKSVLSRYHETRDSLGIEGTSRLSADLKFGTLSARTVWNAAHQALPPASRALASFTNELLWREFSHSILWNRPEVLSKPFRAAFEGFPWEEEPGGWDAWTSGKTGYPVVDASARQLLSEGFVHNRARMISASFLTKNLLTDYRRGEAHYMKYLTDGDWAQNNMGWQWSAGTGCDAQPYFRVFNPTLQGKKFDPEGDYVRRWVPELARLPSKYIHEPWKAPSTAARDAGLRIGADYPKPIVDLTETRERFLRIASGALGGPRS
jgi:deoxyribodipyrimidine photo-lyase